MFGLCYTPSTFQPIGSCWVLQILISLVGTIEWLIERQVVTLLLQKLSPQTEAAIQEEACSVIAELLSEAKMERKYSSPSRRFNEKPTFLDQKLKVF
jgi:hypothetical protein